MTKSQKIIWMTLPNGWSEDGTHLKVSICVSPRLELANKSSSTLQSDFQDFVDWPKTLNKLVTDFKIRAEGHELTPQILSEAADSELWKLLFPATTFVRGYGFDSLEQKHFMSYSNKNLMSFIKTRYSRAAINNMASLPLIEEMLDPRNKQGLLGDIPIMEGQTGGQADNLLFAASKRPRVIDRSTKPDAANDFAELHDFHQRPILPEKNYTLPPLQQPELDFHQAIAAMGQYPQLMRKLGLVVDLQIPVNRKLVKKSDINLQLMHSSFPGTSAKAHLAANTSCYLDPVLFTTKARSNDELLYKGMLRLEKDLFNSCQIDVDGASLKLLDLANNLRNANLGKSAAGQPLKTVDTPNEAALPSLRSAGLSVCLDERAKLLDKRLNEAKSINQSAFDADGAPNEQLTLAAEDLNRGYRVDVYDVALNRWYSLCQRQGNFRLLDPNSTDSVAREMMLEEEGQINFSAASDGAKELLGTETDNLYIVESLFRWDGWSLVAPRPGRSVTEPYKTSDSAVAEAAGYAENTAQTAFKLETEFRAKPGTLPRLRFGNRYRFRMRTVDVAGNSLAADLVPGLDPFNHATEEQYYARFEPVSNPLPVALSPYKVINEYPDFLPKEGLLYSPGESLETLVIRSSYDGQIKVEANQRHIAPPRTSQQMAETHGMFDSAKAINKKAYDLIVRYEENEDVDVSPPLKTFRQDKNGFFAGDQLPLSYLPDPIATCVAFQGLPGVDKNSVFLVGFYQRDKRGKPVGGHVKDRELWPKALPFKISVESGQQPPSWHDGVLTVYLAPAERVTVRYSCQIPHECLPWMGVVRWAKEQSKAAQFKDFMEIAAEGRHWALTPWREMQLVHAVPRPKELPELGLSLKPVVDLDDAVGVDLNVLWQHVTLHESPLDTADLVDESKKFLTDPFSIVRKLGETHTRLWGLLGLHGASTGMLYLNAQWQDPYDDPADESGPQHIRYSGREPLKVKAPVFQCPVVLNGDNQNVAGGNIRYVESKNKKEGLHLGAYHQYAEPPKKGEIRPFISVPPVQEFGDTKARQITYQAIVSTRFRELFEPQRDIIKEKVKHNPNLKQRAEEIEQSFTRTSESVKVVIPSSARPAAPVVRYVIPTFGWTKEAGNGKYTGSRLGGGLRIYLERPWYSSGDGEMLGIVLYIPAKRVKKTPKEVEPYVTQWGQDPIWETQQPKQTPLQEIFKNVDFPGFGLTLDEIQGGEESTVTQRVAVAGYHVHYDQERQLWYSDVVINSGFSYSPMISLALVRYQPFSIENAHLSRVAKTDFVPLTADRHASVSVKSKNGKELTLNIAVTSNTYYTNSAARNGGSVMEASIEVKDPSIDDPQLCWQPMYQSGVILKSEVKKDKARFFQDKTWTEPGTQWWHNDISISQYSSSRQYRLVIKEYEYFEKEDEDSTLKKNIAERLLQEKLRRLVYADMVELTKLI